MVLTGLVAIAMPARSQQPPQALAEFLRQTVGLEAAQLAAVERGEPVVKVLETQNKRDVAVFGIITADAARESYARQLRNFQQSLRNPARSRFGIFADPATTADVQALALNREDADELKKCQPGKCNFKLPATEMQRIQDQVDWSAADQPARVTAYARQRLVAYVTDLPRARRLCARRL